MNKPVYPRQSDSYLKEKEHMEMLPLPLPGGVLLVLLAEIVENGQKHSSGD